MRDLLIGELIKIGVKQMSGQYAVILTGGRQYKVQVGDSLKIEKLAQEPNEKVEFDKVLLVADKDTVQIGTPYIDGAKVVATVAAQERDKKINILKFRRRKHSMKRMGHRQYITRVSIDNIIAG
jgi:large subunit ribosomal protein L21